MYINLFEFIITIFNRQALIPLKNFANNEELFNLNHYYSNNICNQVFNTK